MAPMERKRTLCSDRERSKFDKLKAELLEIGHYNVDLNGSKRFRVKLKFFAKIKRPKEGSRPC